MRSHYIGQLTRGWRRSSVYCVILLAIHITAMATISAWNSPTFEEVAHLGAGLYHWETGRLNMYEVNPPLIRLWATFPIHLTHKNAVAWVTTKRPGGRKEFSNGKNYFATYGRQAIIRLTIARWACLPFTVLGAVTCFVWARELYGEFSGVVALALWCICPNIVGYGSLITPDVAAAALLVFSAYSFSCWIQKGGWFRSFQFGLAFGFAIAAKSTCLVLFGLWPVIWLCRTLPKSRCSECVNSATAAQLMTALFLTVALLNGVYAFEGTFDRLGSYEFVSNTLGGDFDGSQSGNRFRSTWLENIPVPLPRSFVCGVDIQKYDFECRLLSYLGGEWKRGGWWYYYLFALLIKMPLGTWALFCLSVFSAALALVSPRWSDISLGEIIVAATGLTVFCFVSAQTGINHHVRYVLPCLPFVFIFASRWAARPVIDGIRCVTHSVTIVLIIFSAWSSARTYPHSMSYFNESIGGPEYGYKYLANSNVDSGQDLLYLRHWLEKHPEASPIGLVCYDSLIDPKTIGIDYYTPAPSEGPMPGWYAVSVNALSSHLRQYTFFEDVPAVGRIGYSMRIYHISNNDANAIRSRLGFPPLAVGTEVEPSID